MRKGSTHSAESKAKLSAFRKGKVFTRGFKFSAESRRKMSERAKARWARAGCSPSEFFGDRIKRMTPDEALARARVRRRMKLMIRRVMNMPRSRTGKSYEELLGYNREELRRHIEAQFVDGMGWDKPGSFHVDHDVPIAAFISNGITDPRIINALANLKVLTPSANRAKSDIYDMARFWADLGRLTHR